MQAAYCGGIAPRMSDDAHANGQRIDEIKSVQVHSKFSEGNALNRPLSGLAKRTPNAEGDGNRGVEEVKTINVHSKYLD